ncbi:MAG: lysophospholipid acyltransferase family protein [Planctomycetales bacterium]|nr:lysophospholipid acyltransferase family protein [Planctomycetales bacterium]
MRNVKLSDWLGYILLRVLICVVQSQTLSTLDRVSRLLAVVLAHWLPLRKKVIDENLRKAYGDLPPEQCARLREAMWHHLLLMVCEIAIAPRKIHRTNWREYVYMPDKDLLMKYLMDPRPTILVTGHYGNFELAGYLTALLGAPTYTIARPLDNPLANEYLDRFRSSAGQHILPKDGSSQAVQDLLAAGNTLALLADQHAGRKGCWVDFFGHPTSCHKALALFVLSARAPMAVTYARRLNQPLRFEIGCTGVADPSDADTASESHFESVQALTIWYNQKLEAAIRKAPEQYWWLHRRWREAPTMKKKEGKSKSSTAARCQSAA